MTEVKLPAPVKATLVDDIDGLSVVAPGAFTYSHRYGPNSAAPEGMLYACPCGCGHLGHLTFRPASSPSWEWDGNREAPTLSPSVHHVGHWHGYLRAGMWIQA